MVDRQVARCAYILAGEREQLLRQIHALLHGLLDRSRRVAVVLGLVGLAAHVVPALHDEQAIVEVVRNAGGQSADGIELLSLSREELGLPARFLGRLPFDDLRLEAGDGLVLLGQSSLPPIEIALDRADDEQDGKADAAPEQERRDTGPEPDNVIPGIEVGRGRAIPNAQSDGSPER